MGLASMQRNIFWYDLFPFYWTRAELEECMYLLVYNNLNLEGSGFFHSSYRPEAGYQQYQHSKKKHGECRVVFLSHLFECWTNIAW